MGKTFTPLYRIYKSGSVAEDHIIEFTEVYQLLSVDDFIELTLSLKRKNSCIVYRITDGWVYFIIESQNVTKRAPQPGGKIQVEVTTRMKKLDSFAEIQKPWDLPPFNFHVSSAINEESVSEFYPDNGDILLKKADEPYPFVNTAGVMLEGTSSYVTSQITFSYAIQMTYFETFYNNFWQHVGKINSDSVTICGLKFSPRTLRLESLSAEYQELDAPGSVSGSSMIEPVTHHYYRVDVVLNANSSTWNQNFLNIGTHINRNGAISKLWSWSDPLDDSPNSTIYWGTYGDYLRANGRDGQSVSEPMALNKDGTGIMPIDKNNGGRQIMSYRYGSLYEPIPFSSFHFPTQPPKTWRQWS